MTLVKEAGPLPQPCLTAGSFHELLFALTKSVYVHGNPQPPTFSQMPQVVSHSSPLCVYSLRSGGLFPGKSALTPLPCFLAGLHVHISATAPATVLSTCYTPTVGETKGLLIL